MYKWKKIIKFLDIEIEKQHKEPISGKKYRY